MTYLVATTTKDNFLNKLFNLISGAEADDFSTTCDINDRWQILGNNTIAQPKSTGYEITQEHRAGYWARIDDNILQRDGTNFARTWCRQKNILQSWPATYGAMEITIRVQTPNTVAFDYSTAILNVAWNVVNQTTGLFNTANWWTTNTTTDKPAVDGTYTIPIANIGNITNATFQLGDPSGILASGANFIRFFTQRHPGGYDYWRGFEHALPADFTSPTATNEMFVFTVGNELTGVEDTDWEVTGYSKYLPHTKAAISNAVGNYHYTPPANQPISGASGMSAGIGYKTATSLTGNRYEVKFKVYDSVGAINWYSNEQALIFRPGTWGLDESNNPTRFGFGGHPVGFQMCKPFGTTPSGTASIQMFISVTPDWLTVILKPDSAFGGTTVGFQITKIDDEDPRIERGAWAVSWVNGTSNFFRLGLHSTMENMHLFPKGVRDGNRDWQTRWGRSDFWNSTDANNAWVYANRNGWQTIWWANSINECYNMVSTVNKTIANSAINDSNSDLMGLNPRTSDIFPIGPDDRFEGVQFYVADNAYMANGSNNNSNEWRLTEDAGQQQRVGMVAPRGFLKSPMFFIRQSGFSDGDILEETGTGDKATLFVPVNGAYPSRYWDWVRWPGVPTYYGVMLRQW